MHHFSVHKTQTRNHIEPNSLPFRPIGVSFLIFKQEKTEKHQPRKKNQWNKLPNPSIYLLVNCVKKEMFLKAQVFYLLCSMFISFFSFIFSVQWQFCFFI
jgi:hypothetical protein